MLQNDLQSHIQLLDSKEASIAELKMEAEDQLKVQSDLFELINEK